MCSEKAEQSAHSQEAVAPLSPTSASSPHRCLYAFDVCVPVSPPPTWLYPRVSLWVAHL